MINRLALFHMRQIIQKKRLIYDHEKELLILIPDVLNKSKHRNSFALIVHAASCDEAAHPICRPQRPKSMYGTSEMKARILFGVCIPKR